VPIDGAAMRRSPSNRGQQPDPEVAPAGFPADPKGALARRPLRPRLTATLAIAPAVVSDLTAPAVIGLEPRHFREFLRAANIPHAVVGRRAIVRVDQILEAVERLSRQGLPPQSAPEENDERSDDDDGATDLTADDVLAQVGRRRIVR
jgi:hypothetical protein